MVDSFSSNFGSFINELGNISSKGNYAVAPKLKPVKPQTINLGMPALPGSNSAYGNTGVTGGDQLTRLINAIRGQESSGNYAAYNDQSGASGAYQILPSNFNQKGSGWDMEALGRDVDYNEFIVSKTVQDAIAKYKLGQYLKKYGAAGAAVAWYGGEGAVKNMYSKTTQTGGYPSLYAYWTSVLNKM